LTPYLVLLGAGPLLWFTAHWLVGRFAQPRLRFSESATIAVSPFVFAIVATLVANLLQPLAWSMLRATGQV
jgi:hypothetical protein